MSTRVGVLLALAALGSGCLSAWNVSGPWACGEGDTCAGGLTCDDGVCCLPGGSPACPTLPVAGVCANQQPATIFYRDRDGDGAGDPGTGRPFCAAPLKERWVSTATDCNDADPTISPTASERCNALDDDCDGVIDNGLMRSRWYLDEDHDGYGHDCDAGCVLEACSQPDGSVDRPGDCAPLDAGAHPGAPESCNGVDDNCNGVVDDPPFADVETPGFDGGVFDCTPAGLQGVCARGGLQCVFDPATRRFSPTCVPRVAPQPELCGDGLDNDCDGVVDDAPGCGGPRSLLDVRAGTVRAVRLAILDAGTPSHLPARCLAAEPGAQPMAWLNPSWVGSGGAWHVWSLTAPAGLSWDLSATGAALQLELSLPSGLINPASSGWGGAAWFPNPVVTVCGLRAGEYVRLFPSASTFTGNVNQTVTLWSPPAGWRSEFGPVTLDRRHVASLEVVVSPVPPPTGTVTFDLVVSNDAGFR